MLRFIEIFSINSCFLPGVHVGRLSDQPGGDQTQSESLPGEWEPLFVDTLGLGRIVLCVYNFKKSFLRLFCTWRLIRLMPVLLFSTK